MAFFLAGVGVLSLVVLVLLGVGLARRVGGLTRSVTALQKDLMPALKEIEEASRTTRDLAARVEEHARPLRRDDG